MSLSILEDSIKHKPAKKRLVRSESESDVESINDDDRNSLFGSKKNRRPWNLEANSPRAIESFGASKEEEKYDYVISKDLRLAEEIPPLSVYIGSGFAAEIKSFHTDSLSLEIWTEDVYDDLANKFENLVDFSNYNASHRYYSKKYQALLGYLKDETKGIPITEFCALRPKMYSYIFGKENKKTAKGTKKTVVQNILHHDMYLNVLKNDHLIKSKQSSIISKNHIISTI
ncbi:uncharacterized protein TNCT_417931 [Trichonephila clavata]|uniref:Uncharacterized protein n=1 Tax=Trichonephila clavata TaxID=2740835 RepID=A0A8X6LLG6_TRICU|nr:uncharacterized protein TNCT_417931 [Trichonephila clavata]